MVFARCVKCIFDWYFQLLMGFPGQSPIISWRSVFIFIRNCRLFSKWLYHFAFSLVIHEKSFSGSTSWAKLSKNLIRILFELFQSLRILNIFNLEGKVICEIQKLIWGNVPKLSLLSKTIHLVRCWDVYCFTFMYVDLTPVSNGLEGHSKYCLVKPNCIE